MLLDDLEVFQQVAAPLMRPHTFTSLNQLSKRLRLPDDKVVRGVTRLAARLRCELIVKQNRRLVLTSQGERVARLAAQFYSVIAQDDDDAAEVLAIDADPTLVELLPAVMSNFLSAWGGLVAVRINRLDPDPASIRERIASGSSSFGIGWADSDPPATAEVLEPTFPWAALLPETHPLAGVLKVSLESLSRADRVFVPERGVVALSAVLSSVPPTRRVECESGSVVRTMVEAGLGIGLEVDLGRLSALRPDSLCRVPLSDVEPERIALYLPRKTEAVTEAVESLITAIRRVVSAPPLPEPDANTAGEELPADTEVVTA